MPTTRPNAALRAVLASTATCAACTAANAQVVINEILHNPPGAAPTEEHWEYIELYGRPGLALDGLALLVVSGGEDRDRNGVPENEPRLDEAFDLSGHALDGRGCFTLYNADRNGQTGIAPALADAINTPHAAPFAALSLDEGLSIDRLANDGSSTYLLARATPEQLDAMTETMRDRTTIDADFDGAIDDGPLAELHLLDAVAWSHRGGREYLPSTDDELSETVGLNPDALTRIAYHPAAPKIGHRTTDRLDSAGRVVGYRVVHTSRADESFIYGVLDNALFPRTLTYFDGFDFQGWPQLHAPTDPNADPYPLSVEDPEPDANPFGAPIRPSRAGELMLRALEVSGMALTPHAPNAHPDGRLAQQPFLPGDANLDGRLTREDIALAQELLGSSLDESPMLQLHDAQSLLAIIASVPEDDPWTTPVSERHIQAITQAANPSPR